MKATSIPILFLFLLGTIPGAIAQEESAKPAQARRWPPPPGTLSPSFALGNLYQFQGGLQEGGDYSVHRMTLEGGVLWTTTETLSFAATVKAKFDTYSFDGESSFAPASGPAPWERSTTLSLSLSSRIQLEKEWELFFATSGKWAGENDTLFDDAFSFGIVAGASKKLSDSLTVGAGLFFSDRLEKDPLVIPAPMVRWKISEKVTLSNFRGPAGSPINAGLECIYAFDRSKKLSLGFGYESHRFRLDEKGPIDSRGGIGSERSFPIWIRFEWKPIPPIRLHLLAGISLGRELEVEDPSGSALFEEEVDPAPFLAFFAGIRF